MEYRYEREDTTCPNTDCRQPMQRVSEDVNEELDIVPAEFFVHCRIYGKWACRGRQQTHEEPAEPDVVDAAYRRPGWWRTR